MRAHSHWSGLAAEHQGTSVAMGNFDGIHLGHRSVIEVAQTRARDLGVAAGVVTFEPHPRQYFAPKAPPFRLMNAAARAHRLEKLGVEALFVLPFDAAMAGMTAETFVTEVLVGGLGVSHVTVGTDFCFGKGRAGTTATLRALGAAHGFGVTVADLVALDGVEISSTAIRAALAEGRPRDAARMLGHWHRIEGAVIHGAKRGRDLGYPTANIGVEGLHLPRLGIYAVKVDILNGPHAGSYDAAASLGVSPMFGQNQPLLETFVFDFDGDLYGHTLSVAFIDYLRPEMTFDGLPALMAQMAEDCSRARAILRDL